MKKPVSPQRVIAAQNSSSVRNRTQEIDPIVPQSLPRAEIESLLRLAHANSRAQATPDEVLGPGDVQYLRGNLAPQMNPSLSASPPEGWEHSQNPDLLLQQAEQQLADAILNSGQDQIAIVPKAQRNAVDRNSSGSSLTLRPGVTLEDLEDVDLDISIELGRAEILIEELLKLREGSVVSLDKLAGDPVDIVANGRLVARGELLVIDGKFGVRLSEVL